MQWVHSDHSSTFTHSIVYMFYDAICEVLWVNSNSQHHILSGYSLFLALIIDRLHNYVKEIRRLKKNLEAVSKQNKTMLEAAANGKLEESERDQKDISDAKKDT